MIPCVMYLVSTKGVQRAFIVAKDADTRARDNGNVGFVDRSTKAEQRKDRQHNDHQADEIDNTVHLNLRSRRLL